MSDKDIIKALENAKSVVDNNDSETLDFFNNCIDLINHQQAEINKLNAENMLTISERNAFRSSFYDLLKQLKITKSEAIKEFAERLKFKIINTPFEVNCTGENEDYKEGCLRGLVDKQNNIIDMINTDLKEMVGKK